MVKKIENINDYQTAHDAAQVLSAKHGRPIRPDYVSKMRHIKKYHIRTFQFRDRLMYHREDISACWIGGKGPNKQTG